MREFKLHEIKMELRRLGVSEEEYESRKQLLRANNNYSNEADFIWGLLNEMLQSIAVNVTALKDLYQKQRRVYLVMWQMLLAENRDTAHVKKQLVRCDLMAAKEYGLKMEVSIVASMCCAECTKWDDKKMSLDQAIAEQPIPIATCTRHAGCICVYTFSATRDENGRVIKSSY